MKTYLKNRPCRRALYSALGFPNGKLPADFTFDGHLPLVYAFNKAPLGTYHIIVTATQPTGRTRTRWCPKAGHAVEYPVKSSTHRIFAKLGARLIPTGRLHQAIDPSGDLSAVPPGC
jgi:hypothetical protein